MSVETISVIMPAYNAARTIAESIASVLSQTHTNLELIICDDGSNDGTPEVLAGINDPRVRIIANVHRKGAAGARNSALERAQGRFVAFLDSDDLWQPSKLLSQLTFMLERQAAFSYMDYEVFTERYDRPAGTFSAPDAITFADILRTCDVGCLTVMLDRQKLGPIAFPDIPKEDYALWVTLLKSGITAHRAPGVLASYRVGAKSLSSNKLRELGRQFRVLRAIAGLGLPAALWFTTSYAFSGLRKHLLHYRQRT